MILSGAENNRVLRVEFWVVRRAALHELVSCQNHEWMSDDGWLGDMLKPVAPSGSNQDQECARTEVRSCGCHDGRQRETDAEVWIL